MDLNEVEKMTIVARAYSWRLQGRCNCFPGW
jgi:hypothetical protein